METWVLVVTLHWSRVGQVLRTYSDETACWQAGWDWSRQMVKYGAREHVNLLPILYSCEPRDGYVVAHLAGWELLDSDEVNR